MTERCLHSVMTSVGSGNTLLNQLTAKPLWDKIVDKQFSWRLNQTSRLQTPNFCLLRSLSLTWCISSCSRRGSRVGKIQLPLLRLSVSTRRWRERAQYSEGRLMKFKTAVMPQFLPHPQPNNEPQPMFMACRDGGRFMAAAARMAL